MKQNVVKWNDEGFQKHISDLNKIVNIFLKCWNAVGNRRRLLSYWKHRVYFNCFKKVLKFQVVGSTLTLCKRMKAFVLEQLIQKHSVNQSGVCLDAMFVLLI